MVAEVGATASEYYKYLSTTRLIYLAGILLLAAYIIILRATRFYPEARNPRDWLTFPTLKRLARSRAYPAVLQVPVLGGFLLIAYLGFLGPKDTGGSLTTIVTWVIWWPGLALLVLITGRLWCIMCPFGTLGDWAKRVASLSLRLPEGLQNLWLQITIFQILTWAFLFWQADRSPVLTSTLLVALGLFAVATGMVFEKRTFCRYMCPIGGLIGLYSMAAPIELRAKSRVVCQDHRRKDCVLGNRRGRACPMMEFPQEMDRNTYCNFCMECVKTCPRDNLRLSPRPFGEDLWATHRRSADEVSQAAILWGITILENVVMIGWWDISRLSDFTWVYLAFTIVLPLAALSATWLVGRWSGSRATLGEPVNGGSKDNPGSLALSSAMGYLFIPVGLSMNLAHNLEHLLRESPAVIPALREAAAGVSGSLAGSKVKPLVPGLTLFWLQAAILLAGTILSLKLVMRLLRKGNRMALPALLLATLLGAVNIYVLGLPMGIRTVVGAGPGAGSRGYTIAFVSNRNGNWDVFQVNPDGTRLLQVTDTPEGDEEEAGWSPDGTKLLIVSKEDGDREIYVARGDGSGRIRLTDNDVDDWAPVFSPDGSKIAYVSGLGEEAEIYLVNPDGTGRNRLTRDGSWDYIRSWSPDGSKLFFESMRDGNMEIYIMNADGTGLQNLTRNPAQDGDPAWSPGGKEIAFSSDRDGNRELYVMKADGTGIRRVTKNQYWDGHPYWSPDGGKILFESDRGPGGTFEVMVIYPNGHRELNLTRNASNDKHPAWSPDGSKVVFVSDREGNMDLYIMDSNGRNPRNLTGTPADEMSPSW